MQAIHETYTSLIDDIDIIGHLIYTVTPIFRSTDMKGRCQFSVVPVLLVLA